MYKFSTLFLLCSLYLFAQTPELYKSIGDPVYSEIPSVISLSQMPYLKKEKKELDSFVLEAKKHKSLGLVYDDKRRNKTLSKQEQKEYLHQLRKLNKELYNIYNIVKSELSIIIKNRHINTLQRLKRTKIDILRLDPESASSIKTFENRLRREKQLAQKKKAEQNKKNKLAYYNFIRSDKNLNGKWEGKSSDSSLLSASFNKSILYLTYFNKNDTNELKGIYTINNENFNFFIEYTKRIKSDIPRIKKVNFGRIYHIMKITKKELVLKYKDETINLKRSK